jgi:cytochrome c553
MLRKVILELTAVSVLLLEIAACTPFDTRTVHEFPAGSGTAFIPLPLEIVATPKPPDSVQSFMKDHSSFTAWARDDVIVGDLRGLREPLRLLAEYRSDAPELERWKPWLSRMQSVASMTARAGSIESAAAGVATMAVICGECHRATSGGPSQASEAELLRSDSITARMHTHAWASERLWRGLTAPSDGAWLVGASALAHLPSEADDKHPSYAADLAKIRSLGESAAAATTSEERADVYGVLLATCGHCHVRAGVQSVRSIPTHSLREAPAPLLFCAQRALLTRGRSDENVRQVMPQSPAPSQVPVEQ